MDCHGQAVTIMIISPTRRRAAVSESGDHESGPIGTRAGLEIETRRAHRRRPDPCRATSLSRDSKGTGRGRPGATRPCPHTAVTRTGPRHRRYIFDMFAPAAPGRHRRRRAGAGAPPSDSLRRAKPSLKSEPPDSPAAPSQADSDDHPAGRVQIL